MKNDTDTKNLCGKHLSFKLDLETYCLEIIRVQEIIKMREVTHIPKMPGYVRGVIDLRGMVIPVIDLRLKFEMETREDDKKTCIIVVQVEGESRTVTTGVIVDEVAEVVDVTAEQIEPPPSFGGCVDTSFILGIAKVAGKVLTMINIDQVLKNDEMAASEKAA